MEENNVMTKEQLQEDYSNVYVRLRGLPCIEEVNRDKFVQSDRSLVHHSHLRQKFSDDYKL